MFETIEEIEDYLTTKGADNLINIWNNLQESFDNNKDRITFFNRVATKYISKGV